jgi:hypothetical protein
MPGSVQARIDSTLSRADQVLAEQLRREIARQQREDVSRPAPTPRRREPTVNGAGRLR